MKTCARCGKLMPLSSHFCSECGFASIGLAGRQREIADSYTRFLKFERLAWKIAGILNIVAAAFFGFFTFSLSVIAVTERDPDMFAALLLFFIYFTLYLGLAIVNVIAKNKITKYLFLAYSDIKTVADRCGSVGMLVFSIIFNPIAPIFFLINFIRTKRLSAEIEAIAAAQSQALFAPPQSAFVDFS